MDEKEIERLLEKFDKSTLKDFKLSQDDFQLAFSKREAAEPDQTPQPTEVVTSNGTRPVQNGQEQQSQTTTSGQPVDDNVAEITAPLVGVIYFAPSPDKPVFKKQGDQVKKGDVVCVIEAMKMINEVKSDVTGTISNVLVKDGSMVEYGQPLFQVTKG
ncbi:acetyl-CoA carboxylase biotin carboxyl carrier protein [Lentilactobacillus parafarraginis]|jgi:acetyl-CoA carboxylase biotin carboxyl carrier protein|uniref:Biotin carboxyl carrier protein of acetyl-CoA carboxylase n=2 Tax=Lentilactobacillus parafarraginis TaxID=390842 RepID=A0A0R1Z4C7_9LACO|nr:acetyl-CoA carboxylase biotin carboxyl carrier protein [Lentilactobacillus parafarraginis]KRM45859.1 acetyl-CoA carboxylase, biotin carboxyl carrier protein [Lentilactobacillus parafarraginis DSM 18390 = JCM 14109]TLQ19126.1 acetyl-CoA carboxylase biotin carboxyl carrier protein [Lentilactobacillus parafarraginis]